MNNDSLFPDKLQEVLRTKSYELLDEFDYSEKLDQLKNEDRILFARLLIKKGEKELLEGKETFKESFSIADKICADNAFNYFLKGLSLSHAELTDEIAQLATNAFAKAIELDPDFIDAYLAWGNLLIEAGKWQVKQDYFEQAKEVYQKLYPSINSLEDTIKMEFFWRWGVSSYYIGTHSQEPIDFYEAIEKYNLAESFGLKTALFYFNFAESYEELGSLLDQEEMLLKAVSFYVSALEKDINNLQGSFDLARCYKKIYIKNGNPQYYDLADERFKQTIELDANISFVWLFWGKLDLYRVKFMQDDAYAISAVEKLKKSYELDSKNLRALALWAEAEIVLGVHEERLDLLKAAESKIVDAISKIPNEPELWLLYGNCLNQIGVYFNEENYFLQAIDKFQHGLSFESQVVEFWYGLASSYFSLGEVWMDRENFDQAIHYFHKIHKAEKQPSVRFWNDWGVALMKVFEITDERQALEAAIDKFECLLNHPEMHDQHPLIFEALYNYGCALDFMGDISEEVMYYEKSIVILSKSLQINPTCVHSRYNLALSLSHLGEAVSDLASLESAIEHFKILVEVNPEDEMAFHGYGLALLNIAELLNDPLFPEKSQPYFTEAEQKFITALSLGSFGTYYSLACLYSMTNNLDVAMHYIEKAESYKTLPHVEDMLHDEWLENLVETPAFRQFISRIPLS